MQNAHNAYAAAVRTARDAASPRELEAALLLKSATRLQFVADDWEARSGELDGALNYNRKLWTVLVSAVGRAENPLPPEIKRNVLTLANFIFKQSLKIAARPAPGPLATLVSINRDLAAGLRGR
jgi:flagellar protein FlaF